jgi:flagellin
MERLATGTQINRASDDPSGMVAVSDMKLHEARLAKEILAKERERRYLGAREGAQSVIADLVHELESSVVLAANKGALSSEERATLQEQTDALLNTIDHLANTQRFNGEQLLSGWTTKNLTASWSDEKGMDESGSLSSLRSSGEFNLVSGDLESAQKLIKGVSLYISNQQAAVGARMQAVDTEETILRKEAEGTADARSMIEDTDYAKETAALVRAQVLQQAALYVASLALSQSREGILSLLTGSASSKAGEVKA